MQFFLRVLFSSKNPMYEVRHAKIHENKPVEKMSCSGPYILTKEDNGSMITFLYYWHLLLAYNYFYSAFIEPISHKILTEPKRTNNICFV